jgi:hypothetical protein
VSRLPCPEPGVYSVASHDEYRAIDALNFSTIKRGRESIGHLFHSIAHPPPPSRALTIGRAIHCLVLEPAEYAARFVAAPEVDRRTKAGKEEWAAFVAASGSLEVLTASEAEQVAGMADGIRRNSTAAALLGIKSAIREVAVVWRDAETGLMLKCRMDHVVPGKVRTLADLKSTRSAAPRDFSRAIVDYGYDMQSAMYIDGWASVRGEPLDPLLIAVESDSPHACAVYRPDDATIEVGRREYRDILRAIVRVRGGESPTWYGDGVLSIGAPTWHINKFGNLQ